MKNNRFDKFIIMLTATAALLTAITSLFMVLEMRNQRKAISRPIIKLLSSSGNSVIIKLRDTRYCENYNDLEWNWHSFEEPVVIAKNYGMANAINIKFNWIYDYELFKIFFKELDSTYFPESNEKKDGNTYFFVDAILIRAS
jgi:hypothetical protein